MESNDSPEIPDTGETSDIPGLPSGGYTVGRGHIGSWSLRALDTSGQRGHIGILPPMMPGRSRGRNVGKF